MTFREIKRAFRKVGIEYYDLLTYVDDNEEHFFIMLHHCTTEKELVKLMQDTQIHEDFYRHIYINMKDRSYYTNMYTAGLKVSYEDVIKNHSRLLKEFATMWCEAKNKKRLGKCYNKLFLRRGDFKVTDNNWEETYNEISHVEKQNKYMGKRIWDFKMAKFDRGTL